MLVFTIYAGVDDYARAKSLVKAKTLITSIHHILTYVHTMCNWYCVMFVQCLNQLHGVLT